VNSLWQKQFKYYRIYLFSEHLKDLLMRAPGPTPFGKM
jgi:hypothetical protein